MITYKGKIQTTQGIITYHVNMFDNVLQTWEIIFTDGYTSITGDGLTELIETLFIFNPNEVIE